MDPASPTASDLILDYLSSRTGRVTPREIEAGVGLPKQTVATALRRLRLSGDIKYAGDEHGADLRGVYEGRGSNPKFSEPSVSETIAEPRSTHVGHTSDGEDFVAITIYSDVKVSAGPGTLVVEGDPRTATRERIGRAILRALLGFDPPPHMQGMYVDGVSMLKTRGTGSGILDRQLVFFAPTSEMLDGRRYVMAIEERAGIWRETVKRFYRLAFGAFKLVPDNGDAGIRTETFTPANDMDPADGLFVNTETGRSGQIRCIGEVLWPRERDDAEQIRLIQMTVEQLRATGVLD